MEDYTITFTVGICILAAIAAPVSCSMNDNYAITQMVKAGANPMDAKCSVKLPNANDPVCVLRAAGKAVEMPK